MGSDIVLHSSILVVDDSFFILNFVQNLLKDTYNVRIATSAEKAYEILGEFTPDLILLDLEMPKTNGLLALEALKSTPEWRDIPVIFLTGTSDRKKEEQALSNGAVDYILKPISPGVLTKRIQLHLELMAYQKKLESLVDLKTDQLLKTQDLILDVLANVTNYRDNDTGAHIIRTTHYSKIIVQRLLETRHPAYDINAAYADNIIKTAKLHDIGKIAVSDAILLKNGKLTPSEFDDMKRHTVIGAQMINHAVINLRDEAGFLITAKEIILHHHEWWNGKGYPGALKGCDIPVSARIMAIADVYDALISRRPYKEALTHEEAVGIMKSETGTHFDIVLMDIIDKILPEFKEVASTFID